MTYHIEFFSSAVKEEILDWPAGIHASFVRTTEKMMEFGPNTQQLHKKNANYACN